MKNIYYFKFDNIEKELWLKDLVKKVVDFALKEQEINEKSEISVTFTNNEGVKKINKEYRNINKETDVLSFPTVIDDEEFEINPSNGALMVGDIVISVEKAKQQAIEFNHSLERELAFLTVHSVLHLLGYDHEISTDEEVIMLKRQEEILQKLGYSR